MIIAIAVSILLLVIVIVTFWELLPEGRPVLAIMDIIAVIWLAINITNYYR